MAIQLITGVNLAESYSPHLDKAFKLNSYTNPYVNEDYTFEGVNQINVWSTDSVPLKPYNMASTTDRYGGFTEVTDTLQTFKLANVMSFKTAIDRLNSDDSMHAKKATEWLAQEVNEVFIPTLDRNRLSTAWVSGVKATGGGGHNTYVPADILKDIREMNANMDEVSAPMNGRVFFCDSFAINDLKAATDTFFSNTSSAAIKRRQEPVGHIDGVPIIQVPSNLMPGGVRVLGYHKKGLLSARKLTETQIDDGKDRVCGSIIYGIFRYDSFVLSGQGKKLATFQALSSNDATMKSFSIGAATASINASTHAVAITVPSDTVVTALKASFTLAPGATAKVGTTAQVSGTTPNNFTAAVDYVVTAADGTTSITYAVTVTKAQ